MITLAHRLYMDTKAGATVPLHRSGTGLENPFVFDACARDIKALADLGCVDIVSEQRGKLHHEDLITDLVFKKLR